MRYLFDENLPDYLKIWTSDDCLHVTNISKSVSDNEIWKYALENNLIILTKDSDFHEGYFTETLHQRLSCLN